MLIIGIDPGLDGGIAIIDGNAIELLETIPTQPKTGFIKRQVNTFELARILRPFKDSFCYLEQVASRPGQGVGSVFSFGDTYGSIRGVLGALEIPVYTVTPNAWKKTLKISSKEDSLKASETIFNLPKMKKKDHNLAEALLIAFWGHAHKTNMNIEALNGD
jgi:crossover junction endodeoxyribonuclease RuvC